MHHEAVSSKMLPAGVEKSPQPPQPLQGGLISKLPQSVQPIAQLVRIEKPGFIYYFVPMASGALQAGALRDIDAQYMVETTLKLFAMAVPLCYINHSYNDTVDADLDRLVKRTKNRPIARGALSKTAANVVNLVLFTICALMSTLLFPLNFSLYMVAVTLGAMAYPFAKRVTMLPGVYLGFVLALGVLLGSSTAGVTPFIDGRHGAAGAPLWARLATMPAEERSVMWLYLAIVAWTICIETVYSFQDASDDASAGVGSLPLLIRDKGPKRVLWALVLIQIGSMVMAGVEGHNGHWYYLLSVGAVAVSMIAQVVLVDLDKPSDCLWWFTRGAWMTGTAMVGGLAIEFVARIDGGVSA